jgi:hypothetical protein
MYLSGAISDDTLTISWKPKPSTKKKKEAEERSGLFHNVKTNKIPFFFYIFTS